MTGSAQGALLIETLAMLKEAVSDALPSSAAHNRLRTLRDQFPETRIDLVWQEQAFDASVHYDALIREPGNGAIVLSFCPDRAVPWPLRGVQHVGDQYLLRVDNGYMRVDQAMACIDFVWNQTDVLERLIDVCLMQQMLEADPIELSDGELQDAMDAFRRAHRLYTASDTCAWLQHRGLTPLQLEEKVRDQAVILRLKERMTGDQVRPYFEEHRADFERVRVALLGLASPEQARELCGRLSSGASSFYELVEQAEADLRTVTWSRRDAPPELVDELFDARAGEILGPLPLKSETVLVRVLAHESARLDQATAKLIQDLLVRQFLDARRADADIEWYWGNDRPGDEARATYNQ